MFQRNRNSVTTCITGSSKDKNYQGKKTPSWGNFPHFNVGRQQFHFSLVISVRTQRNSFGDDRCRTRLSLRGKVRKTTVNMEIDSTNDNTDNSRTR